MADRAISMRLHTELLERLDHHAKARGLNRSELIRKVLSAFCDQQEGVRRG